MIYPSSKVCYIITSEKSIYYLKVQAMNFLKFIGTSVPAKFVNVFPSTITVVLKLMAMMIVDNALDWIDTHVRAFYC